MKTMAIASASAAGRSFFRSKLFRNAATRLVSNSKTSPSSFRFRSPSSKLVSRRIFRRPVELSACLESMLPYHTATASSLMISSLNVSRCGYGWIFEDM